MSLDKTPKTDRFQIMTAVLFMSLFAVAFLIVLIPKDNITTFVCNYARGFDGFARMCPDLPSTAASNDSGQYVGSRINSACVDAQGLKISVVFDMPVTGEAIIQVFSTGPDFFPSARGLTDTYETTRTNSTAVDRLDLVIPVDSMPVGEQIFGNIVVSGGRVSNQLSYFINVSDCASPPVLPPELTPNSIPTIQSATCLPSNQLMIAFEFDKPMLGQYQASVADRPYQLASAVNQPAILFFSGEPPPEGPVVVRLISAIDQIIIFEETYTPPVCRNT